MTKQVAVRLPQELVAFVDTLVASGDEPSRAAVVTRALERDRRRRIAERDAEILRGSGSASDLDALAAHVADQPVDLG